MTTIPLITERDGFEIVRDKIAQAITDEIALQQALAIVAELDPNDWKVDTYLERSRPWEVFRDSPETQTPIVNVWYDSSPTELNASNLSTRQNMTSVFNIDCLAYSKAKADGSGFIAGDEQAAKNAHKTARLVRQILMHDKYRYLELRTFVGRRYVQSRTAFQPNDGNQAVQNVMGVRLALAVKHDEYISLADFNNLEQVFVEMKFEPDGQVIASMDINF
jgi:hypothetical protein